MKRRKLGSLALILAVGLTMSMATSPIYSAPTESIITLSSEAAETSANLTAGQVASSAVGGALFGGSIGSPVGAALGAAYGAIGSIVLQLWPSSEMAPATTPAELLD